MLKRFINKTGKAVKTTRNHQLVDKLTSKRKNGCGTAFDQNLTYEKKKSTRKPKLETIPHDLSAAIHSGITSGNKVMNKIGKRSRMKGTNLFTSKTTPTSNAKNSLKTTINNSTAQGVFMVNKSFWNKLKKKKPDNFDH